MTGGIRFEIDGPLATHQKQRIDGPKRVGFGGSVCQSELGFRVQLSGAALQRVPPTTDHEMNSQCEAAAARIQGPLAPINTPFDARDELDATSLAHWVNWMAERSVPVMWTTGGTSEMVSMTEAEIFRLTESVAEANRGRSFYIASTGPTWPVSKCLGSIHVL